MTAHYRHNRIEAELRRGYELREARKDGRDQATEALGGFDPSGRQSIVATGTCENPTRQVSRQEPSGRQENRTERRTETKATEEEKLMARVR